MSRRGLLLSLTTAVLTCVIAGCGGAPVASGPSGLFDVHCAKCHAQAGQPGGPPSIGSSKGPDLAKITTRPGRDADYIARFIRDPKGVKPDAKLMPAFAGKLTDDEIRSLAEYVAAMK
jgi:mono/diheme cytochrome c family protein